MLNIIDSSSYALPVNNRDNQRDHSIHQSFSSYSPKSRYRFLSKRESSSLINQDGASSFLSSPAKWNSELAASENTDLSLTQRIIHPSSHSPSFHPTRSYSISTDHISPPSLSPALSKLILSNLILVDITSTTLPNEVDEKGIDQLNETNPSIPVLQVGN